MDKLVENLEVRTDLVKIIIKSLPDKPGMIGNVFTRLGEAEFNVEAFAQAVTSAERCDVAFAVRNEEGPAVLAYVYKQLEALDARGVIADKNLALLVLNGEKLAATPGISGKVFSILGQLGINIEVITGGHRSLAVMIPRDRADEAARAIRAGFGLV